MLVLKDMKIKLSLVARNLFENWVLNNIKLTVKLVYAQLRFKAVG